MAHFKLPLTAIVFSLFFLSSAKLMSQDMHFSQSLSNPLVINPALTGLIEGNYRAAILYRDQWRSVLDNNFKAFAASGDLRFSRGGSIRKNPDYFGAGIMFLSDRVSNFDLNTTQISVSTAYHKALDKNMNQYLSLGAQIGIVQKNINYEDIVFQDQFDGVSGFTFNTQEFLPANNFGYMDITVGGHYSISPFDNLRVFTGAAMHHLTEPEISFYANSTQPTTVTSTLFNKLVAHLSFSYRLSEKYSLAPRIYYTSQGPHQVAQVGSNFRIEKLSADNTAFQLGAWIRGVKSGTVYEWESFVTMIGLELSGMFIGISYDSNLQAIKNNFSNQGAFELSVTYIGNYENDTQFCPEF